MSNSSQFSGSIPHFYDTGLGPNLFTFYAQDISNRVAEKSPKSVLELAAGTGIVTEKLAMVLDDMVDIISTDLNPDMLEIAQQKLLGNNHVSFQTANAIDLPFENEQFDIILNQFGIMFFPDKFASLKEAERVLKEGGHYIFNVWCDWTKNPAARVAHETVASFFDGPPPSFFEVPYGYNDREEITSLLMQAGFSSVDVHPLKHKAPVKDFHALAEALVYGNPINLEIKALGGNPDDAVIEIEKNLLKNFGDSQTISLEAFVFEAAK